MKLLIKIPTRERGFEWLRHYTQNVELDTKIVLTLDSDQEILPEWLIDSGISVIIDDSQNKVHAYNRDIDQIDFDWDVLLVGSDDMWPQVKGFDRIILEDMKKYFPDTDGCLWYDTEDSDKVKHINAPKGTKKFLERSICMLPVMGRKYYQRFGYVYNPIYTAFWCDNEYTRIAQRNRKIQYIENRIIRHQHPDWDAGMPVDNLYMRNNPHFKTDMKIFNNRQRNGFIN